MKKETTRQTERYARLADRCNSLMFGSEDLDTEGIKDAAMLIKKQRNRKTRDRVRQIIMNTLYYQLSLFEKDCP